MEPGNLACRYIELISCGGYDALGDVLHADVVTHYGSDEPVRGPAATAQPSALGVTSASIILRTHNATWWRRGCAAWVPG